MTKLKQKLTIFFLAICFSLTLGLFSGTYIKNKGFAEIGCGDYSLRIEPDASFVGSIEYTSDGKVFTMEEGATFEDKEVIKVYIDSSEEYVIGFGKNYSGPKFDISRDNKNEFSFTMPENDVELVIVKNQEGYNLISEENNEEQDTPNPSEETKEISVSKTESRAVYGDSTNNQVTFSVTHTGFDASFDVNKVSFVFYTNDTYSVEDSTTLESFESIIFDADSGNVIVKTKTAETKTNAGNYYFKLKYDETFSNGVCVNVEKALLTAPTIEHKTYNGENQTADFDTTFFEAIQNNGGTDAGEYDVILKVKDSVNYKWVDSDNETKTLTFVIDKANQTISFENETVNKEFGDSNFINTLFGLKTSATFNSTNKDVATVNENGEITIAGVGETTIEIVANENTNYNSATKSYRLIVSQRASVTIEIEDVSKVYDGENLRTPTITSLNTVGEKTFTWYKKVDSEFVETTETKDTGVYKVVVVISATAEYGEATGEKEFTISRKNITGATVTLGANLTYNRNTQTKVVSSVIIDNLRATFIVSNNEQTNVGEYTLTITGTGNFEGEIQEQFEIYKCDISSATVTLGDGLTFNGQSQTQAVLKVMLGEMILTPGTEYTVVDNTVVTAGKHTLRVVGVGSNAQEGNFAGEVLVDFYIEQFDIAGATVKLGSGLIYNGEEQEQLVDSVVYNYTNGASLNIDDFEVTNNKAVNSGSYTLTVTGKGNFKGSVNSSFVIERQKIEKPKYKDANKVYIFNGRFQTLELEDVDRNKVDVYGEVQKDINELGHKVRFVLKSNYSWEDGVYDLELKFVIHSDKHVVWVFVEEENIMYKKCLNCGSTFNNEYKAVEGTKENYNLENKDNNNQNDASGVTLISGKILDNTKSVFKNLDMEELEPSIKRNFEAKVSKDSEILSLYEIALESDGIRVENIDGNKYKVRIKLTDKLKERENLGIICIDENGKIETGFNAIVSADGKYIEFETTHFSTWAIYGDKIETENVGLIVTIFVIAVLITLYLVCYFVLYRTGKLDSKKIGVIYKWLSKKKA